MSSIELAFALQQCLHACPSSIILHALYEKCLPAFRHGTYKLVQKMPGGEKLVAFTRILHRTKPDVLMDEVGRHGG